MAWPIKGQHSFLANIHAEQMFILSITTPLMASIHKGKVSSAGRVCPSLLSSIPAGNQWYLLASFHIPSSYRALTIQLSHRPLLIFLFFLFYLLFIYVLLIVFGGIIVFAEPGGGIPPVFIL